MSDTSPDGEPVPGTLSFDLHALTARLDRAADRILRAAHGITYRRFRTLLSVQLLNQAGAHAVTQRAVADEVGISEPSASRMVAVLADAGLLDVRQDPGSGNRRRLQLTPQGSAIVEQGQDLLEERFADLVRRSGVSYTHYAHSTRALLDALGAGDPDHD
ncbi:MarR family transcriptional regulator, transcriptional regulator for hemolysin [Promicromonospora umidemergens]|uniref:HTH marR-type domain-containing protein n=1 Tax=Promicromonospora umidemergens TaxID=629679 RepID=A0ABP8Y011_9MICO|nr:MarR family transcriptional regulator [Promicromonospora umidemergens]MCP2286322.1 MarR family transcriptional regulator, transcriptional regulator for hemolysin [Promicromonospora umidemergens]